MKHIYDNSNNNGKFSFLPPSYYWTCNNKCQHKIKFRKFRKLRITEVKIIKLNSKALNLELDE